MSQKKKIALWAIAGISIFIILYMVFLQIRLSAISKRVSTADDAMKDIKNLNWVLDTTDSTDDSRAAENAESTETDYDMETALSSFTDDDIQSYLDTSA